jgi:hypothetical protein
MAIPQQHESQPVDVHELAAALAEMVKDEPSVLRIWVSNHRDVVSLWLLTTTSIATVDERRLYGLSGALFDRFPDALFHVHVLNPLDYEPFDLNVALPKGAEEIALRAA